MFGGGFSKIKLQAGLRTAQQRIKLVRSKRTNEIRAERKSVADMLAAKSFDKARIRVESVIRKQHEMAAEEILELMVELLLERINLISTEKTMPADISETVQTVVWAAARTQIEELRAVKEQLLLRYGPQITKEEKGGGRHVNPDVESRLVSTPPTEAEKLVEFEGIAAEYGVKFDRKDVVSVIGLAPLPPDIAALTAPLPPPSSKGPGGGGAASSADVKPSGPAIGIGLPVEPPGGFVYCDASGAVIHPGAYPGAGGHGFGPGFGGPGYGGGPGFGVGFGMMPLGGGFPVATPGYPGGFPPQQQHGPPAAAFHGKPTPEDLAFDAEFSKGGSGGGITYAQPPVQVGGVGLGFTPGGDLVVSGPPGTTVQVVRPLGSAAPAPEPPLPPPGADPSGGAEQLAAVACPLPPHAGGGAPPEDGGDAASPPSYEALQARFAALNSLKS